jgi:hypothetical protein
VSRGAISGQGGRGFADVLGGAVTTRSAVLGHFQSTVSVLSGNVFTVPAGQTWIVKSVVTLNGNGSSSAAVVSVSTTPTAMGVYLVNKTLAGVTADYWEGWVVMVPGDVLAVLAGLDNVRFWISGTKLIGVAS